jgi:DNA-binding CsgD family transcriptional regulator
VERLLLRIDTTELVAMIQAETLQAAAARLFPRLSVKLQLDLVAIVVDFGTALETHVLWRDSVSTHVVNKHSRSVLAHGFPYTVDANNDQHQRLVALETDEARSVSLLLSRAADKGAFRANEDIYVDSLQPLLTALVRRAVAGRSAAMDACKSDWDTLSPAEARVVDLVREGMSNKDAARRLGISHHTVRTHLEHAFCKLGVKNRTQLAGMPERTQDGWRAGP